MNSALAGVLQILRDHQTELHALGARHIAVFGSVARGENGPDSDVDVLVDLDGERAMGVFEYARLRLRIAGLIGNSVDVVNRRSLKPLLRANILKEAVDVF